MTTLLALPQAPDRAWSLGGLLGLLAAATAAGYLGVRGLVLGAAVALLPAAVVLLVRLEVTVILMAALVPFGRDLLGGVIPVQVGGSDVLLGIALAGVACSLLLRRDTRDRLSALAPLAKPFTLYAAALLVVLVAHPDLKGALTTFQRLQLTLLPAVLGALFVDARVLLAALRGFVISSSLLAAGFLLTGFGSGVAGVWGTQKNPAGQFMVTAILLVLAVPSLGGRWRLLLPLLAAGLIATQSRGAFVALVAGLVVLLLIKSSVPRYRMLLGVAVLIALTWVTFNALPDSAQQRFTNTDSSSDFALQTRDTYREDALALFREHPVLGVGVGHYLTGRDDDLSLSTDPHNVVLLELAEGGVVLGGALLALIFVPAVALVRRSGSPYAAVALAVQVGTILHGLVDVYWVRSTPVLGWFLVGAALAAAAQPPSRRRPVPL